MLKFIADGEASVRTGKERTAHHVMGTRCIPACSGQREFDDLKTRRLPEKALIQFADTMTEIAYIACKSKSDKYFFSEQPQSVMQKLQNKKYV